MQPLIYLSAVAGLSQAFVMGEDLINILTVYAIALSGDAATQTWSIGGPYIGLLSGPLGQPQGISYSHSKYEGDVSFTRVSFSSMTPRQLADHT